MKKLLISSGIAIAAFASIITASLPDSANAQVASSTGTMILACHTFNQNLGMGLALSYSDAEALSHALGNAGVWSSGVPTAGYNASVAAAVTAFQNKYASEILYPLGLSQGTGYVGVMTRSKLNRLYGCGTGTALLPVQCPAGYTCTPINPQTVMCPLGYTCTPIGGTPTGQTSTSTSSTTATSTASTTSSVSIALAGTPTIQSSSFSQTGQSTGLVVNFPLRVTSNGGSLALLSATDFNVVFIDTNGNRYIAPNISVSTSPNGAIAANTTSNVTVTASIPATSLPASGLYTAAITLFRWNQDGSIVSQTYGLEDLKTSASANFVK